jgi:hypothetical protein
MAPAMLSLELAIRTRLRPNKLEIAAKIPNEMNLVALRPVGPGERGDSPFGFHSLVITALGNGKTCAADQSWGDASMCQKWVAKCPCNLGGALPGSR